MITNFAFFWVALLLRKSNNYASEQNVDLPILIHYLFSMLQLSWYVLLLKQTYLWTNSTHKFTS